MKTIKSYIVAGAATVLLLSSTSCSKKFYTDANINPNSPNNVPSSSLLTGVEVALAYSQGGAGSQFTSMFTQQTMGVDRQAQAYYEYIFTPADPEYLWDMTYANVMENDYALMNQAQAGGQNEYYGIANILMAYSLQVTVDAWGNIPYSTALQGAANLQPTYDQGSTLYNTTIMNLLNTGITALGETPGPIYPSTDDVIYNGTESDWIAFAHAIKARIYINQCKHGNVAYEDSAIAEATAAGALAGSFVNAQVLFGSAATNNAPWFQFNNQRGGYIQFQPTSLIDSMQGWNDPRDSVFVSFSSGALGNYYGSATSPVEFITTEELDLIIAEANVRLNQIPTAQVAYTSAINANMTKLGVSATDQAAYALTSNATLPPTQAAALHQVGLQQWVCLYLNPSAWTSYRRTGSPVLTPVVGNEVAQRLIYPTTEQTLNAANCPTGVTMFLPAIFWNN